MFFKVFDLKGIWWVGLMLGLGSEAHVFLENEINMLS